MTKTLAVFDLDNTLTDTLTFWAAAITPVAHAMTDKFGMDENHFKAVIQKAPSQYRFCDVGSLVTWLDERGELPRAQNPADQHDIELAKWSLRQNWYGMQKKMSVFYPGALDTLRALKDKGTDVALYTDTEASSMIRRVWLMAYNARRAGLIKDEEEILDLFDHFYAQPAIEDDEAILRDADLRFVLRMKQMTSIWTGSAYKPAPHYLAAIMDDFGAMPEQTVMIGDTHNDGGCAVPQGASFAWAHYGARLSPVTEQRARAMASPLYKYGVADIQAAFTAASRPDTTLQDSLKELLGAYHFSAGNGFNPRNVSGAGAPPRNPAGPAHGTLPVWRLRDAPPSPRRRSPMGPATHFEPKP